MIASGRQNHQILVVEDDIQFQDLLKSQLAARQYEVQIASDGLEAITFLPDLQPDLVLLDITLPGLDGLEVCRQMRQQSDIPIIMVTDIDTPEMKMQALE